MILIAKTTRIQYRQYISTTERKQRTTRDILLFGVPQGLTSTPLLFNIFLQELFLIMEYIDFASYADDITTCIINDDRDQVVSALEDASLSLFKLV